MISIFSAIIYGISFVISFLFGRRVTKNEMYRKDDKEKGIVIDNISKINKKSVESANERSDELYKRLNRYVRD